MGNFMSSESKLNDTQDNERKFKNLYDVIDYIATYYILTMDFKSLSKLSEKDYCDKLVILTSDIIERYFNNMEVEFLAQRVKSGVEVNELTKGNVSFINKDNLESLDISNDTQKTIRKKRICIGIAKFYVKIAHIFAAIVKTINPIYLYKDEQGNTVETPLLKKDTIPKNTKREIVRLNICDNRIKALKNNEIYSDDGKEVTIQPKICSINLRKDGETKNLTDEPGINEIMQLYLDDKYDYSNGTFTGMSDETKKQFMKDLRTFYTVFTGNEDMPPNITKFSDIKLRDYKNQSGCQGENPLFKRSYTLNKNDKLFVDYATNIRKMIETASSKQSELLSIINDIFAYIIDPYTGKKVIRINPTLTEEKLQSLVVKTRNVIIELYINCEKDYVKGIKLYEAIVEYKILETTQKQIENLEKQAVNIIKTTKESMKIKPKPLPDNVDDKIKINIETPLVNNNNPNNININPSNNMNEKINSI